MTTAYLVGAAVLVFAGLVFGLAHFAKKAGRLEGTTDANAEADRQRREREALDDDLRRRPAADVEQRLREDWTRDRL